MKPRCCKRPGPKKSWVADTARSIAAVSTGFGDHVDATAFAIELHLAVDQSEQRVVFAASDTAAGVKFGADLANQNVPGTDRFAAELLDAATLRVAVTTVAATALSLFVCHGAGEYFVRMN